MKLWKKPRLAAALCAVVVLVCAAAPAVFLSVVDAASLGHSQAVADPYTAPTPTADDYYLLRQLSARQLTQSKYTFQPGDTGQERKPLIYYNNQANDKNGRVSKVVGFIAGRLNMRVLGRRTSDGKIDFYFKTRGETRVLAKILEQMDEDNYDGVHPVLISECGNQTAARLLEHGILAKWPEAPVRIVPCSGLCSFYAQDQGIIITY